MLLLNPPKKHYSGEAVNVYISVQQIYSGQHVPNLYQKHFFVFLVHSVVIVQRLFLQVAVGQVRAKLVLTKLTERRQDRHRESVKPG